MNEERYGLGYISKIKDYTQKTTVHLYKPVYGTKQNYKHKLLSYIFEPILSSEGIKDLYLSFENKKLAKSLFDRFSFNHNFLLEYCHLWYRNECGHKNYYNVEKIYNDYLNSKNNKSSCPIFKFYNSEINDIPNLHSTLMNMLLFCERNGISDIQQLNHIELNTELEELKKMQDDCIRAVDNLTYERFGNFLKEEKRRYESIHQVNLLIYTQERIGKKPIFDERYQNDIYTALKRQFDKKQHPALKELIETGNEVIEPLICLCNQKILVDAFCELYKNGEIITGCNQIQLAEWITDNFRFIIGGKEKKASKAVINNLLSKNPAKEDSNKNPILIAKKNNDGTIKIVGSSV